MDIHNDSNKMKTPSEELTKSGKRSDQVAKKITKVERKLIRAILYEAYEASQNQSFPNKRTPREMDMIKDLVFNKL